MRALCTGHYTYLVDFDHLRPPVPVVIPLHTLLLPSLRRLLLFLLSRQLISDRIGLCMALRGALSYFLLFCFQLFFYPAT